LYFGGLATGTYCLADLDGAVPKLRYAAFRIVPHLTHSRNSIPVTYIVDRKDPATLVQDALYNDTDAETDELGSVEV
jgi:hypothetical protein